MRKAALRGQLNLQKRYVFAAACYNLSQLLRKKFGCGTLKMALATAWARFLNYWLTLSALPDRCPIRPSNFQLRPLSCPAFLAANAYNSRFSTVC
jgi:hypothetical protein